MGEMTNKIVWGIMSSIFIEAIMWFLYWGMWKHYRGEIQGNLNQA